MTNRGRVEKSCVGTLVCSALALACGGLAGAGQDREREEPSEPAGGQPEVVAGEGAGLQSGVSLTVAERTRPWRALAAPGGGLASGFEGGLWAVAASYDSELESALSALYHSPDGVRWRRVPVGNGPGGRLLSLPRCIGGRCVLVERRGNVDRPYHYRQGSWVSSGVRLPEGHRLAVAGEHFFLLDEVCRGEGLPGGYLSLDGASWSEMALPRDEEPCFFDVAFGGGRHVVGGVRTDRTSRVVAYHSLDAERWSLSEIPACDPVEGQDGLWPSPCSLFRLFFAAGRFFGQNVSSANGRQWAPESFVAWSVHGNTLVGSTASWDAELGDEIQRSDPIVYEEHLASVANPPAHSPLEWTRAEYLREPNVGLPPDELSYPWADGLDCTNRRCLLDALVPYLVPREGDSP